MVRCFWNRLIGFIVLRIIVIYVIGVKYNIGLWFCLYKKERELSK